MSSIAFRDLFNSPRLQEHVRQFGKVALLAALSTLGACSSLTQPSSATDVAWRTATQQFVPFDSMLRDLGSSDIVLLGETHDNAVHHRTQDRILAALAGAGRNPVLVMEQFDLEQQPALDAIRSSGEPPAAMQASLRKLMGPGWEWPGYEPLLKTAVNLKLRIVAANISRDALRSVSKNGFGALGTGEAERMALTAGWSSAQQAMLEQDIAEGHCGSLPPAAVTAVALSQRARDAVMADRLLQAGGSGVAIGILGRGHVRRDLAVPLYLKARSPQSRVRSVDLAEGVSGATPETAAAAVEQSVNALGPLYDYLLFTGRAAERASDPCDAFRKPANTPSP